MIPGLIAVTGATGGVGSRVARLLSDRGASTVLVVRDASRAPRVAEAQCREASGYLDRHAMESAFEGCQTAFLVSGRESANRVAEHTAAVEAAVAAGVERVVYLSFQGASKDCTFTFGRDHWHTEQLIRSTPLAFTFFRDSFYHAGLAAMCGSDGVIRGPGGSGSVAAVSHEDVAAVVAESLLSDEWVGASLDVTGPEAITLDEVALGLARASGHNVRYVNETIEEAYASRAHYGADPFEITGWVSSYAAIANGEVSQVSDTVERLTGRPPISFATFLTQHRDAYRHINPGNG